MALSKITRFATLSLGVLSLLLFSCSDEDPRMATGPQSPTLVLSEADFTTLQVDAEALPGGKGTADRPFSTLEAALKFAERQDIEHVELQLAAGLYEGDRIYVDRDLRIVGPGLLASEPARLRVAFHNSSTCSMEFRGVAFEEPDGPHPAILDIENGGATTKLQNVSFSNIVGHAVRQAGGSLYAENMFIQNVLRNPSSAGPLSGTALLLTEGVDATLLGVQVSDADGPGLVTIGPGTPVTALIASVFSNVAGYAIHQVSGTLTAYGVEVQNVLRHPEAAVDDRLTGTAVLLTGGIQADLRDVAVDGAQGSGLYFGGAGTRVTLQRGNSNISSAITNCIGCLGAVAVMDGAFLRGSDFSLDGNGGTGVNISGQGTVGILVLVQIYRTRALEEGDVTYALCGDENAANVSISSGAQAVVAGSHGGDPAIISESTVGIRLLAGDGPTPSSLSLQYCIVSNHSIGLHSAGDPAFHEIGVDWFNNDVIFDGTTMATPRPSLEWICSDGIDDDGDGAVDMCDSDCHLPPICN